MATQTDGDAVDRAPGGPSTSGRAQELALMRELRPEIAKLAGYTPRPSSPGTLASFLFPPLLAAARQASLSPELGGHLRSLRAAGPALDQPFWLNVW